MKKYLAFFIVLLAICIIAPVFASATRTTVTGNAALSVTSIGEIDVTKSGMMHQTGAVASGLITGDFSGEMQIELSASFNMNTGKGVAFGTFTIADAQGAFEGVFRVKDSEFTHFIGSGEAFGTGAYNGMMLQLSFQGEDLYRGGYTGPNGLTMTYSGDLLSPKGQ